MLKIEQNKDLSELNTFGLRVKSKFFCGIHDKSELQELIQNGILQNEPRFVLGGGSNVLFVTDFDGIVVKSEMKSVRIVEKTDDYAIVSAGSGMVWHEFVEFCLDNDLFGLENLSKIPGTVGAAAVQNIGAYGKEQKDCFYCLNLTDLDTGEERKFMLEDCKFDYRYSIFKNKEFKDKFFIDEVQYKLQLQPNVNTKYKDIQEKLAELNITEPTPKQLFKIIEEIRDKKLPDYKVLGNVGSFFKNPVVSREHFEEISKRYKNIPHFDDPNGVKIPAAWLIEQGDMKGFRLISAGVSDKHALILVNYGDKNGINIWNLSVMVINVVRVRFGIELEREVVVVCNKD